QDIKESQEKIKQRKRSEDKRYMDYYKVNYQKESNYNLVIDTTNLSPEKVIKAIRKSISL
ncbi:MAG TPA: cytidylate kinase, partial [Candidatus Nanoarchaeia archaeon]|nr:cytidylate kinase [Candidatus Nanoarchaeia archaeon]